MLFNCAYSPMTVYMRLDECLVRPNTALGPGPALDHMHIKWSLTLRIRRARWTALSAILV
jgi:hypothetical protein